MCIRITVRRQKREQKKGQYEFKHQAAHLKRLINFVTEQGVQKIKIYLLLIFYYITNTSIILSGHFFKVCAVLNTVHLQVKTFYLCLGVFFNTAVIGWCGRQALAEPNKEKELGPNVGQTFRT